MRSHLGDIFFGVELTDAVRDPCYTVAAHCSHEDILCISSELPKIFSSESRSKCRMESAQFILAIFSAKSLDGDPKLVEENVQTFLLILQSIFPKINQIDSNSRKNDEDAFWIDTSIVLAQKKSLTGSA